MSGDHKTRSRSLSPGSGSCRRRYDWNTIHFYPDIHQPSENASRLFSSSGERDAIETVTSHDDSQDDDSDDYQSSDDAAEWCYSPSDDDECVKSAHHDDVTENVAKEKTTRDVRKRVKWLDQQKQEDSAEEIAEENQAERVNSSSSSSSSRWPRKEQNNSCLRRHPVVKYETNVDSESSSSEDDDDDDDDDGHLPGENSSKGVSNGAHLLYIDESDEEDTQQQQQQQPLSSSAEAEEISRSTENERGEEKKKVEGPRYLETHLDDDTWPQVDYDGAMDAVFKAIASSKEEEEEEEEEEQITTLKSILRAKHTSHPQPRDNVYAPSRDRSRVKAAGNLEKLENADFSPIVENERLVDWSSAERPPRSTPPHSLWRPTAAEEKEEEAKGGKEGQHRQPSAVAAVDGGGGDDDAMSRMREQRNRRRFVFDYRRTLIDGKMAADDSSSSDGASDALTLEEFELCLDIRKDEHPPQEQQQQQPEVGSHISETSVPISKPETNISNFYKRIDDVTMASSVQEDPEILWLFDSAQRPRIQDTGGRSIADGSTSSRRPRSADSANTQYPRIILEENSFEWHDGRRNVCDRFSADYFQLPSTVTRQQYRWSTCIREPEARLLIDDFQPNDVTSLSRRDLPMTSRYPAMYKMKKFPLYRKSSLDDDSTTEKKRKERTAAAAAGERSFTVIGQPRSRKPLQLGGEVDSATTGYALAAAAAHRALGTIHEGGSYRASDRRPQPSFVQQTHCHEDCSPQNDARKYKYLRERVLTSVAPPTPEDSLPPLSRSAVGYQSLQNLDDMLTGRKQLDRSHRQQSPSNQMTTTTMTSSTQSLPHNLLLLPLLPHPSDQSANTDRRRFFSASDRSMTTSSGPRNSASIEAEKEQARDLPLAAGNYFYGGGGGGGDTVSVCSDSGFSRSIQPNRFRPNTQQMKTPRIIKARNQLKALHKGKVSEEHHQLIKSSEV